MLRLVYKTKEKKRAQAVLKRALKATLEKQGTRNIGFPGGNVDQTIYSSGEGTLWVAFGVVSEPTTPRYWNAFGVYRPDRPAQMITVEINIPTDSNSARVAGFFAEDTDTGEIYLMHSGKVGGGSPGIGKSAFLVQSKAKLVEVFDPEEGGVRNGIAVGRLDDHHLAERIWAFVSRVRIFKDKNAAGTLDTPDFKRRIDEFDSYSKEFSGKKKGRRGGEFEYVTYHGDIVQAICDERTACAARDEEIFNSSLIDLFVKKAGVVSEVYEVKTGVGRQVLYTAIGQIVTHAATAGDEVTKYLVVPADETIARDLEQAMAVLHIKVRRFKLIGSGLKRTVRLI